MDSGACPLWVNSGHRHQVRLMSALPPKADIPQRRLDVRFVPKTDIRREGFNWDRDALWLFQSLAAREIAES
jgi:hypothetical protein